MSKKVCKSLQIVPKYFFHSNQKNIVKKGTTLRKQKQNGKSLKVQDYITILL